MSRKKLHLINRILVEAAAISLITYWVWKISDLARHASGDGPHILGTATRLAQQLIDGHFKMFVYCFSSLLGPHPPFAYVPFVLAELIIPNQSWTHLLGGAIIIWLCWDGIRRLGGGLIGFVWLVSATPVWLQAENAGIDLVAAACVIQSLSHLVSSKELTQKYHVMGWGAWMGAAFMCKYTAPLFLWAPCILAGWWVLRRHRWKRLFLAIGAFAFVALPWWSTHLNNVLGYVQVSGNAASGLLTNKKIITEPWTMENMLWYPATMADALGWNALMLMSCAFFVPRKKRSTSLVCLLSILGGWLILNNQSQRQDRYILPAYPMAAAALGNSYLAIPSLLISIPTLQQTANIYTLPCSSPPQRGYDHAYFIPGTRQLGAGKRWKCPSQTCEQYSSFQNKWDARHGQWQTGECPDQAYWPISLNPDDWGIDEALVKVRKHHGSDKGTVGFLLEEEGGAPGFGVILRRATALGYRWHIATAMVVQAGHQRSNSQGSRPLASIFVGPFTIGNWPSRQFDVLLVMGKRKNPQWERWIQSTNMNLAESWALPKNRKARIYVATSAD